jgi:hypothetical protein
MPSTWKVDEVRPVQMVSQRMKGNTLCFEVEVVSGWQRKVVNACVSATGVLALPADFDQKMKHALVRTYAEQELEHGWDPEHNPALALKKETVERLVRQLKSSVG